MRGAVSMALAYNQVKKIEKHSFSIGFVFFCFVFLFSICSVMIGLSFLFLNTD
jgi:hypothetical protein